MTSIKIAVLQKLNALLEIIDHVEIPVLKKDRCEQNQIYQVMLWLVVANFNYII